MKCASLNCCFCPPDLQVILYGFLKKNEELLKTLSKDLILGTRLMQSSI